MHRRFLFPLAAAVVGLVAISPVFAAEPSPSKAGSGPAKATTTSSPKGGSAGAGASSTTANTAGTDSSATTGSSTDGKGNTPPPTSGPGSSGSAPSGPGSSGSAPPPSQGGGGAPGSSSNCAPPQTDQGPAPQVGQPPQNHGAGDAGNVDVERLSPTELRIAKVNPNNGWNQQASAPSGPRVTVKFTHPGGSPSIVHFAASMDQAGRVIHVRVQSCG